MIRCISLIVHVLNLREIDVYYVVDPAICLARRVLISMPLKSEYTMLFGWDNLPRTLLMYCTNLILAQKVYFIQLSAIHPNSETQLSIVI